LVFRDKEGTIQNNPENKLNPFTAGELILREDSMKDVVDFGKKQQGAGSKPGEEEEPGAASAGFDINGAKTQVEADEAIQNRLMKSGLAKGTQEFAEKQTEIRKELKVGELPVT